MKWAVILVGVLAAVSLLLADVIGFFAFIPPVGLLLLAPTLFLYLLAVWGVSAVLPIRPAWAAWGAARGAAVVIVVGLASLAVLPLRLSAMADFERRVAVPDVAPAKRIALTGDVRIEQGYAAGERVCDDLCLAVLDMPGVVSVTLADPDGASAFRLMPAAAAAAAADPAAVVQPRNPGAVTAWSGSGGDSLAVDAYWQARLSGPERLVKGAPAARADYTLRPFADEILRGRTVIARRTAVRVAVPITPPLLWPTHLSSDAAFGNGPFTLASEWRTYEGKAERLPPGPEAEARPAALQPPQPCAAGGEASLYAVMGCWLALREYGRVSEGGSGVSAPQSPDQSFASSP